MSRAQIASTIRSLPFVVDHEHQADISAVLKDPASFICISGFDRLAAGGLDEIDREQTQEGIIFDDEDDRPKQRDGAGHRNSPYALGRPFLRFSRFD